MAKPFKYDVFLSHCLKDTAVARELAERLKRDGLRVWFYKSEIKPLQRAVTMQRLEQSRTLVLCLSDNITATEWGTLERHIALFRDPANQQRRFVPLRLDDAEIKDALKQFACVDWQHRSNEQYAKLLTACHPLVVTATPAIEPRDKLSSSKVLKGHIDAVNGVAVTTDGRWAVSGSDDTAMRVWDIEQGKCIATLEGHTNLVWGVAVTADGRRAVSGSSDKTVRVWDIEQGKCIATLKGHTRSVNGVAVTADGRRAVSGSSDTTMRVWDIDNGECVAMFEGHTYEVLGVAVTADGRRAVSGSADTTVRVWDIERGKCIAMLEGHTYEVLGVAVTADGRRAVSGSSDNTVRVWDIEQGKCIATLKGHTNRVLGVTVTGDGQRAVSGSYDNTVRVWELPPYDKKAIKELETTRYTNAKVVLVGESGVGKTGLALRLCEDRWEATESTHGMIISQLKFGKETNPSDIEREVWLWDFAGQPDYRLIHQLYMDETALGVLVFDPQNDNPFDALGHWEKALHTAAKAKGMTCSKLLVAARCDRGGITVSRKRFEEFCQAHGFAGFLITGAKTGDGCTELKAAIAQHIPWDLLPWITTTRLFKSLKDALLKLKEEDSPLVRLLELRQRLQLLLPTETINADSLRTVVGLMQGQGVVQMLDFGDFVLLQPEQINRYASVVVRMAREHIDEMGVVPEQQVLNGQLDYQDMVRLSETDEKILLPAIMQTFLKRALCLREDTPTGTMLVFPSYFRRDKPEVPDYPNVFVTYGFAGPLDEIYATLVVRLSYSDAFKKDHLWKNAAEFATHSGKRAGLMMKLKGEGKAEIVVYFDMGVPDETKVTFIKYVHEHLRAKCEDVTRIRHYYCLNKKCGEPVESFRAIQKALERKAKTIPCQYCDKGIPLFDLIEEKFHSDDVQREVRKMEEQAEIKQDTESLSMVLLGQAISISAEAGQMFRPLVWGDWGIDGEIEFRDHEGKLSGQRVYLQLKSGDSYLKPRKRDSAEVFYISKDNERWVEYWQQQAYPVMLVIRTSDGKIRWMDVTEYLKRHSKGGKQVKQIVFDGEPFTAPNLLKMRDQLMPIR